MVQVMSEHKMFEQSAGENGKLRPPKFSKPCSVFRCTNRSQSFCPRENINWFWPWMCFSSHVCL